MVIENIKPLAGKKHMVDVYSRSFPRVAAFVRKMGGSFEDARDVFHDSLVIYYEKQNKQGFVAGINESAYITGIAKHLWYSKHRDDKKYVSLYSSIATLADDEKTPGISSGLLRFVELSGKKCLELLTAFYYENTPMKELATRFGFSGERSATSQKFKCLEKVREAVRKRALSKEDFYV